MRCRLCGGRAGWLRRSCPVCVRLLAVVTARRGSGLSQIVDELIATGVDREHIESFLTADPDGHGTVKDQIIADMTNDLMTALGQTSQQTAADVKRLREQGGGAGYDRRPSE